MPRIYVEFSGLSQIGNRCKTVASKVENIQSDFQRTVRELDWDIRFQSNIESTATQLSKKLEQYSKVLESFRQFIEDARDEYVDLDEYKKLPLSFEITPKIYQVFGPGGQLDFDWNNIDWSSIFEDIIISKPYMLPSILSLVSPMTNLLYITSGIYSGNSPSILNSYRVSSSHATADWLGYEISSDNPGIAAWVGQASAEAQNEWGYAGVNAYLGKAEAKADADFAFMKTERKTAYKNGKWSDYSDTTFLAAEAAASASVSALAADADAGIGSDMLGLEGKAEGNVGSATAEAKGKVSVGEDGVNAYVKGEAMVSAVEGKAEGTINILGLEITGKVGGYAGAAGVEGKVGIEDNKLVIEGGVAALIGGSAGLEIGFNEEGWDNFVDFIIFWD